MAAGSPETSSCLKEKVIQNYSEIATSKPKEYALKILEAGINAVLPENLMKNIRYKDNTLFVHDNAHSVKGRLFVIGAGKASAKMAACVEDIIGVNNITAGVVNSVQTVKTKIIKINIAGHPYPDINSVNGTKQILDLKQKYNINENDLILCLISGGGSALMTLPEDNINLDELIELTKSLIKSGASIQEINCVRKHMSKVKGGKLAKHFFPVKVISLIISDVIGNDLTVIASGPTVADKTTYQDAYNVLKKYNIKANSIIENIGKGINYKISETPTAINYIIGDNRKALISMADKANELGLTAHILTSSLEGESSEKAKEILKKITKFKRPCAIILGGESTVSLPKKHGKGGRNQEYILSTLLYSSLQGKWAVASLGSDGSDYLKEIAGAIIDNTTPKNELKKYLLNHDSYTILKKLNALIITGDTGTNVCDLIVYVI